jgi:hypothetical protein
MEISKNIFSRTTLYDNICQLNLNTHGGQMTQYKVVREKIFLDISIYSDEKKAYIMLVLFIITKFKI